MFTGYIFTFFSHPLHILNSNLSKSGQNYITKESLGNTSFAVTKGGVYAMITFYGNVTITGGNIISGDTSVQVLIQTESPARTGVYSCVIKTTSNTLSFSNPCNIIRVA